MRATAVPFLMPSTDVVHLVKATLRCSSYHEDEWPDFLDAWDPTTPLEITIQAEVNQHKLHSGCRLGEGAVARLGVTWKASNSALRGRGAFQDIPLDGLTDERSVFELHFTIQGSCLSGMLTIDTGLILLNPGEGHYVLSPTVPGTLLWSESITTSLEGVGTRFPVEVIDFSRTNWLPAEASWHLSWNSEELNSVALGSMVLQINSSNALLIAAVTAPDSSAESRAIVEVVQFDVARSLIQGALRNEDFVSSPDQYDDGSIGSTVQNLITALFPHHSAAVLAGRLRDRPELFEAELQSALMLFRGNR